MWLVSDSQRVCVSVNLTVKRLLAMCDADAKVMASRVMIWVGGCGQVRLTKADRETNQIFCAHASFLFIN